MRRCIELARKAKGNTYPNPLVGSVIVHDDVIIGEGYHHKAGEPHAEVHAINSVQNKDLLKEATIYVSLEPCSHFGKTPPCANKIIDHQLKKVVIGMLDPHDKVNGKGMEILKNAGVEVVAGVLEDECGELNKRFVTYQTQKRPYIILKWAQSEDGFMDDDFKTAKISNDLSSQKVHLIRSQEHAILVGTRTALVDNPSLTTRKISGRNPIRVVLDFDLKIPREYSVFNSEAETIIFNSIIDQTEDHLKWIKVDKQNLLPQIMEHLYQLQIQSVLVEGGAYTLKQFLDNNYWDEAVVITNTQLNLEKGTLAPSINHHPIAVEFLRTDKWEFYKNR